MALFIVYDATSGSPTVRYPLRWGECPSASVAAQATGAGEAVMVVPSIAGLALPSGYGGFGLDTITGVITFYGAPYSPTPAEYERAMHEARAEVEAALRACDWAVLPDAPLTAPQKDEWLVWRAKLRALPLNPSFGQPNSSVWDGPTPTTTEF